MEVGLEPIAGVNEAPVEPQSRLPGASPGLAEKAALWPFPGARPQASPQASVRVPASGTKNKDHPLRVAFVFAVIRSGTRSRIKKKPRWGFFSGMGSGLQA